MIKLTTTIITFNEEHNIERCINSVKEVSDEIIVVDSYSTDKTKEICQRLNVTFIENEFKGHIEQKNFSLECSNNDYILSLDADEALDDQLRQEISEIKKDFSCSGYSFNRLTHYVDQWIFHCGWYPDKKLRLFKKSKAKWAGVNPHDLIEMDEGATTKSLKGNLLHYSYDSISDHIGQTNKFTTISATEAYNQGKKSSYFKITTRPILKFLKDFFLKKGFLDGRYGFIICFINALSALLKYSKLKDLEDGREIK